MLKNALFVSLIQIVFVHNSFEVVGELESKPTHKKLTFTGYNTFFYNIFCRKQMHKYIS